MAAALTGSSGHRDSSPEGPPPLYRRALQRATRYAYGPLSPCGSLLPISTSSSNGIIITIASNRRFHHKIDGYQEVVQDTAVAAPVKALRRTRSWQNNISKVKKSETFKGTRDRHLVGLLSPGSGKVRSMELSLSQDVTNP
ncbi:hypothetical protein Syun_010829 [Stephania yunnanensis]|uniref:Uncharacterized protein n=1 Tax=Stephania yunnanensis TaxID=152371 RepID=A0AAP0KJT7_9MAGN